MELLLQITLNTLGDIIAVTPLVPVEKKLKIILSVVDGSSGEDRSRMVTEGGVAEMNRFLSKATEADTRVPTLLLKVLPSVLGAGNPVQDADIYLPPSREMRPKRTVSSAPPFS